MQPAHPAPGSKCGNSVAYRRSRRSQLLTLTRFLAQLFRKPRFTREIAAIAMTTASLQTSLVKRQEAPEVAKNSGPQEPDALVSLRDLVHLSGPPAHGRDLP